jgi:hypothetical protein
MGHGELLASETVGYFISGSSRQRATHSSHRYRGTTVPAVKYLLTTLLEGTRRKAPFPRIQYPQLDCPGGGPGRFLCYPHDAMSLNPIKRGNVDAISRDVCRQDP